MALPKKFGCSEQSVRNWMSQQNADEGLTDEVMTDEREEPAPWHPSELCLLAGDNRLQLLDSFPVLAVVLGHSEVSITISATATTARLSSAVSGGGT